MRFSEYILLFQAVQAFYRGNAEGVPGVGPVSYTHLYRTQAQIIFSVMLFYVFHSKEGVFFPAVIPSRIQHSGHLQEILFHNSKRLLQARGSYDFFKSPLLFPQDILFLQLKGSKQLHRLDVYKRQP